MFSSFLSFVVSFYLPSFLSFCFLQTFFFCEEKLDTTSIRAKDCGRVPLGEREANRDCVCKEFGRISQYHCGGGAPCFLFDSPHPLHKERRENKGKTARNDDDNRKKILNPAVWHHRLTNTNQTLVFLSVSSLFLKIWKRNIQNLNSTFLGGFLFSLQTLCVGCGVQYNWSRKEVLIWYVSINSSATVVREKFLSLPRVIWSFISRQKVQTSCYTFIRLANSSATTSAARGHDSTDRRHQLLVVW